jgi:hypothetical protein
MLIRSRAPAWAKDGQGELVLQGKQKLLTRPSARIRTSSRTHAMA